MRVQSDRERKFSFSWHTHACPTAISRAEGCNNSQTLPWHNSKKLSFFVTHKQSNILNTIIMNHIHTIFIRSGNMSHCRIVYTRKWTVTRFFFFNFRLMRLVWGIYLSKISRRRLSGHVLKRGLEFAFTWDVITNSLQLSLNRLNKFKSWALLGLSIPFYFVDDMYSSRTQLKK